MNLKKKLAVFMSLSSLLNTVTAKGVDTINYNFNRDYINDFDQQDNEENDEYDKFINNFNLEPIDYLSELTKLDLVTALSALFTVVGAYKKMCDNSITVPKQLPKEKENKEAAPIPTEVENQIEWSNSLSWSDLVKKSQNLWKQQGYEFNRENNPQNMTIKAKLKSNEIYYNKPFHIPKGIFGPIYAVQESKIKEKCNNNDEQFNQNINSLRRGRVPLCDCDGLLVNARMELTQILVAMLQNLQNYMNKKHQFRDINKDTTKLLSLGDILHIFNKLVEKLTNGGHKSPVNTASWFFFGATNQNQYRSLCEGLAPCMELIKNLLPILGLYGMQVPGRYGYYENIPILRYFVQFYNEQCKWDFAIPIRSEKENGKEVSYQIGNTNVVLKKESNGMECKPGVPINVDDLNVLQTDLAGNGWKARIIIGGANLFMNLGKPVLGMNDLKDFVTVFATRLAVYTSRLEPLVKFIEYLDDMYQQGKKDIESLLKNIEKLTGKNESIETAEQIIKEYSPESEKGKILRQLLDLFKRNFEDSDLDTMLNHANYFKKDLPTVFQKYDEKAVKQKENDYIKELNEKKAKDDEERELYYCSLQELNNRLSKVAKDSKEEYYIYYELAKRCVYTGRASGASLAYIVNKYIGTTGLRANYPKAIGALERLILRSLKSYPWKELELIRDKLDKNTVENELKKLKEQVSNYRGVNNWKEYNALKDLTEFYIEEGAFDTKILEPINFIEKRYIGKTVYTSEYPKAINALKHILKCYWNDCKCEELGFIESQYNSNKELQTLKQDVKNTKGKGDRYEYKALDSLTEFYALEGLLEPQILNRLDFIEKKYIDSAWFKGDYNSAVQAVKRLIRRNYDIYKWEELKFIQDQYNAEEEFKKLKNEIQKSTGKNNCDEYKSLEKLAEFYVLEGLLEPEISETLEFIRGKYIKGNWVWGNYSGAIQAITRLLVRRSKGSDLDKWKEFNYIQSRYNAQDAADELNKLEQEVAKSNTKNWSDYYKYTPLENLAKFYIEEGLLSPQILDEANKKITGMKGWRNYSNAVKFLQEVLGQVQY